MCDAIGSHYQGIDCPLKKATKMHLTKPMYASIHSNRTGEYWLTVFSLSDTIAIKKKRHFITGRYGMRLNI